MKLIIIVFNLSPDRDAKLKFSVSEGSRLDSVWLANWDNSISDHLLAYSRRHLAQQKK